MLIVSFHGKKNYSYLDKRGKKHTFNNMYAGVVVSKNAGIIQTITTPIALKILRLIA